MGRQGFLHGASLHQGYLAPGQDRKEGGHRNYAQSAYLYEYEYYRLTEVRPVGRRIVYDKSRNAACGSSRKDRFIERCNNTICR